MNTAPEELVTYTGRLTLTAVRHEYDDVSTYIFKPENPVPFAPGQYGHVRILSLPEDIRRVREFSFASSPRAEEIWFGVDSKSNSVYQQALRALSPGDTVELFKIKSHLTWPSPESDSVMIANGVGVTPFRSMLLDIQEQHLPITTTVVHVARDSFLYKDDFEKMATTYLPIQREAVVETLEQISSEHPNAHYYIAGSASFIQDVAQRLSEKGIEKIETDEFKGVFEE